LHREDAGLLVHIVEVMTHRWWHTVGDPCRSGIELTRPETVERIKRGNLVIVGSDEASPMLY
jgi:hypothetical protein